jgi:hypothetical protein
MHPSPEGQVVAPGAQAAQAPAPDEPEVPPLEVAPVEALVPEELVAPLLELVVTATTQVASGVHT